MKREKSFFSFLRIPVYLLLAVVLLLNAIILLSGRYYIYTGIYNTYLQGRTGPSIYDLDVFPTAKMQASHQPEAWKERLQSLSNLDLESLQRMKSTAFLVFHRGTLVAEHYFGVHQRSTVSNSFSMAKTLVAFLVGIAIEDGAIKSLDEPVAAYLPEFKQMGREHITIRHLLQMSSGLDWEESGVNPFSENAESYYGTNLYKLVTRQLPIEQPGKSFKYLSGNTQLLAFVLQKATGKSVPEYAQEKIWKRIGTEHAAEWSLEKENGDAKAFCCFYATARDFARLGKLVLQDGKWGKEGVVPTWFVKEMVKNPLLKTKEGLINRRYGLHIWTYLDNQHPIYYFQGLKGQYIIIDPHNELVIVRLGEKRSPEVSLEDIEKRKSRNTEIGKIGHSPDLLFYLKLGRKALKTQ
jgi:CubicO group peptidase (beta-lactamase class C family)